MAAGVDCLSRDAAVRHPLRVMHNDRPGWCTATRMTPGAPTDSGRTSMFSTPAWLRDLGFATTLSLNPLVVLVVRTGAGSLFGMVGLTLAAPLTSAGVHISGRLRAQREAERAPPGVRASPEPAGA